MTSLFVLLGGVLISTVHAAVGPFYPDSTSDQPFICDYRRLAWEFAKGIQPTHDATLTFDALMLGTTCNMTRPPVPEPAPLPQPTHCDVYVAVDGDDSHSGTSPSTALASPQAGVNAAQKMGGSRTVCLGNGTFFLTQSLQLTDKNSYLTLHGAGATWLSGAVRLPSLAWAPYQVNPAKNSTLHVYTGMNNQHGCTPSNSTPIATGQCGCYPNVTTETECQARCESLGSDTCKSFAWSAPSHTPWSSQCCIHPDNTWSPTPQDNRVSGRWEGCEPARNTWKAPIPPSLASILPHGAQLRINGGRSARARFPNGNPELDQWPVGWASPAPGWLPPKPPSSNPIYIDVVNKLLMTRNHLAPLNETLNYTGGIGGPCENFDPPFSYWCGSHPTGGGAFQYYVPSGMVVADGTFPTGTNPLNWSAKGKGATVHAFRRGHWASWMFDVADVNDTAITFGKGGYQGCRGGNGDEWYVENVLELLDGGPDVQEHYLDLESSPPMLYMSVNATSGPPPSDIQLEVPVLQTLLNITGSQSGPVSNVSVISVGFRDAAPTYMEPHGVPSGGDWALERQGAVFVEGTVGFAMDSCTFQRVDGNGVMISGFNRHASITRSHFAWTGATAIAAWGRTDELSDGGVHGWDATAGDIPVGTRVEECIMRESGIWEKQSSCFFQAKAAGSMVKKNLCFNLPRAGVNFNDGAAGGDEVSGNLIFNSCRETSDHGPVNSWDRQPYVTTFGIAGPGVPTAHMIPRNISYNFLVANYGGGNGGVDNDDESLRYDNNHNFQVYGHQKFKTGAIRSFGNVLAYVSSFGGSWPTPGTISDEPNVMFNNQVWFAVNDSACHNDNPTEWIGNRSYNNKLVGINVHIGRKKTLPEWQALNPGVNDVGSTWQNITLINQSSAIMAAATQLLGPYLEGRA